MANRREWDEEWGKIASLLQHCRRSVSMSLADAQRWFDGAPDLTLSPLFMQSVVSQVLHDRWEQWQALLRDRLTGLVYSADALALTDAGWSEPAAWWVWTAIHGGWTP